MPHALQAKQARKMDKHTVLCTLTDSGFNRSSSTHVVPHSALPRKVAASISDEGCPPCCRVSGTNNRFYHKILIVYPSIILLIQTCATDAPTDIVQASSGSQTEPTATASA